jgi:hypothetical protein
VSLLGCEPSVNGEPVQPVNGEPVKLLTGNYGCYAGGAGQGEGGLIVPDDEFGTRLDGRGPLIWPEGYTGVRLASGQVVVLNGNGDVKATTGKRYKWAPAPGPGNVPERPTGPNPIKVCVDHPFAEVLF